MTTADLSTVAAADAPSAQGFRATMRCRWRTDAGTGRLEAHWEEALELWPPSAPVPDGVT